MCGSIGAGNKLLLEWTTLGVAAKGPNGTASIVGHGTNIVVL